MRKFYVFKNGITNKYLGIDNGSGGYPFETDGILSAFRTYSLEEAIAMSRRRDEVINDSKSYLTCNDRSYFEIFPKETENLKLVRVTLQEEVM